MSKITIKVDTDAIARNGKMPKGSKRDPAIIISKTVGSGPPSDERVHMVTIIGSCCVVQDDDKPGALSSDGRLARVWIEMRGDYEINRHDFSGQSLQVAAVTSF